MVICISQKCPSEASKTMTKNDPPGDIDHFMDREFKTDAQRNKLYVLYHDMTLIHFSFDTYHCVVNSPS